MYTFSVERERTAGVSFPHSAKCKNAKINPWSPCNRMKTRGRVENVKRRGRVKSNKKTKKLKIHVINIHNKGNRR